MYSAMYLCVFKINIPALMLIGIYWIHPVHSSILASVCQWSIVYTLLCLIFWIDYFHILPKRSLTWECMLLVITCGLTYKVKVIQLWLHNRTAKISLIARFMGPTWGPSGADRTQVGPMLAPWTLLSGMVYLLCPLYSTYSSWWIHSIYGTNDQ